MLHKGSNLPAENHIIRHIPWKLLIKDDQENIIGIFPQAFELREKDNGCLSVNWLEFFAANEEANITLALASVKSARDVPTKSAFAIGLVQKVKGICQKSNTSVRIVFAPNTNNPSHSQIRHFPATDLSVLDELSQEGFPKLVQARNIPACSLIP